MKIVDCFIFNDELQMLDFRLAEMSHAVDHHVLVEGTRTVAGNPKPLYFDANKERYAAYLPKIVHVIVDDFPTRDIAPPITHAKLQHIMGMEHHQRRCIDRGLRRLGLKNNDILIITDCDEVPDPVVIDSVRQSTIDDEVLCLGMDQYYYDWQCQVGGPSASKIMTVLAYLKQQSDPQVIRAQVSPCPARLARAGWHCSYFGGVDTIIRKLQTFAHQEFNDPKYLDREQMATIIANRGDILLRPLPTYRHVPIETNDYLPEHYDLLKTVTQ